MSSVIERICARSVRVDRGYVTPCRVFTGHTDDRGYGQVGIGQKVVRVHVVVYEHVFGPVIDGHHVHHRCEQEDCHEPLHLVDLTVPEHAAQHLPTHCTQGHEYTPENTYVGRQKGGKFMVRKCRRCRRERWKK